ncbi:MAG: F-box protein [Nitrosomonas sp.]|nr:F-box protein [Nitrosomonas sp.]
MEHFPLDLLAHCLSFVQLQDVKSCWFVCRSFAAAITTKPHFWKRFIEAHLKKHNALQYTKHFDPFFSFHKKETLQEQVCFLFRRNFWFTITDNNHQIFLHRRINNIWISSCCIDKASNIILGYSLFESFIGRWDMKQGECISFVPISRLNVNQKQFRKEGKLYFIENFVCNDFNALWTGKVKIVGDRIGAHGKGKWVFADGSILEGEHVAHYGKPVQMIDYEEWRSLKRQKT